MTLLADATYTSDDAIFLDQAENYELVLNSCTLTFQGNAYLYVQRNTEIKNGSIVSYALGGAVSMYADGSLDNVSVEAVNETHALYIPDGAQVSVSGSSFKTSTYTPIYIPKGQLTLDSNITLTYPETSWGLELGKEGKLVVNCNLGNTYTIRGSTGAIVTAAAGYTLNRDNFKFLTENSNAMMHDDGTEITIGTCEIVPREICIDSVAIKEKTYDGTTDAAVESINCSNIISGDEVYVSAAAEFVDANAGEDKEVKVKDIILSGDDADNYEIDAEVTTTGSIKPKDIIVTPDTDQTKTYGEEDPEFTYKAEELISGDTLEGELDREAGEDVGEYAYTTGTLSNGNYSIKLANDVKFEITKATPVIDNVSGAIPANIISAEEITVTGEASWKGNPVEGTFTVNNKDVTLKYGENEVAYTFNKVSVTAEDAKQFVYYIKITDNAGNVGFISTNGAVFDLQAPVITGITEGATYYTTQEFTITDAHKIKVEVYEPGGKGQTDLVFEGSQVDGTISGNRDTEYTVEATDELGNVSSVSVMVKPIASLSESIDTITVRNVTGDDSEAIKAVEEAIAAVDITHATEEEKDALEREQQNVDNLQPVIEEMKTLVEEIIKNQAMQIKQLIT